MYVYVRTYTYLHTYMSNSLDEWRYVQSRMMPIWDFYCILYQKCCKPGQDAKRLKIYFIQVFHMAQGCLQSNQSAGHSPRNAEHSNCFEIEEMYHMEKL